ncbi:hypothetical protein GQ43DRAFT_98424 [Delitschia confertaspora ATCC 74209]|uniref:Uncharacterized protein n=1 Tax=Delitschia confertaspora ATCC 74209 TaxID=1513339 RepID=A0A9P4JNV6_9PLEO|nr:hypothetical protein GQ43DRAFT_98424 [Delitschia confertaspora ATCC 74209]
MEQHLRKKGKETDSTRNGKYLSRLGYVRSISHPHFHTLGNHGTGHGDGVSVSIEIPLRLPMTLGMTVMSCY